MDRVNDADAEVYEQKLVHSVYDNIAPHFSSTRYKPWPRVAAFLETFRSGALVGDIGCGNGKNSHLAFHALQLASSSPPEGTARLLYSLCVDRSVELLKLAKGYGLEAHAGDGLRLPYRSSVFEGVICIAVLHHFCTAARRQRAAAELVRILSVGGRALVYVWATKAKGGKFVSGGGAKRARDEKGGPSDPPSTDHKGMDVLVDWQMHQKFDGAEAVHQRYYHLFQEGELSELFSSAVPAGWGIQMQPEYFDKENWCLEFTRCR
jgi:SAM-dependent methyltransferase